MNWSRRALLVALAALCAAPTFVATPSFAQAATQRVVPGAERPPVLVVTDRDSVHVYLVTVPELFQGFVVDGGAPGGPMRRMTPEPVRPTRDDRRVGEVLQEQLEEVLRIAEVADAAALLRKAEFDPFASGVLTFTYPRMAELVGRRWSFARSRGDSLLALRVTFVRGDGRETGPSHSVRVRLAEVGVPAPTQLRATEQGVAVRLRWSYPAYRATNDDIAFGYHVYRSTGGEAPVRITARLIARDAERSPAFEDPSVAPGVAYTYTVRAVDIIGREGAASAGATITLPDRRPPAMIVGLKGVAGDGRATVSWQRAPEPDARGYFIERTTRANGAYARLNTVMMPVEMVEYTDTTVTAGPQYFYRIVARDSAGNESAPSNPINVVPFDNTPPYPPSQVRGSLAAGRTLRLTWLPSPSSDVLGYYIYRAEEGREQTRVTPQVITRTAYTDVGTDSSGLEPGRTYQMSVSALDRSFNESPAASFTIKVPDDDPPRAPTGLRVENFHGRYIEVSWSAGGSLDVKHYALRRSADGAPRVPLRDLDVNASRSYRDTAVAHGHRYTYAVIAVDSAGNRSAAAVDSVRFGDESPPPAPRNAYARAAAAGGVTVHWERVIDGELAGYLVFRSPIPTGVFTKVTAGPVSELQWTDAKAPPGSWYVVRALDRSGNLSEPSPAVRVPRP